MTERIQTGIHPDSDQMSVFLEGAATEHERARMLEHLAHCAACREMVFLAQGAETELLPAVAPERSRPAKWGRRWWMPVGLVGATLAFLLALVIYMRQPVAPVGSGQVAGAQRPATAVNGPRAEATGQTHPPAQPSSHADRLAAPARPSPAVAMNEQGMQDARGNSLRVPEDTAGAAPAGQAVAKLQSSPVPEAEAPPPMPTAEPAGAQGYSVVGGLTVTGRNVAALQILHDQGTSEGVGEVSGVVTDASGAAIARATVSLRSAADQAVREVETGEDGRFRIADVVAGRYELRVTARGFMTASQPLELKSRDVALLEPVLRVGAESQTVTVEANNAAMETSQAEVSAPSLEGRLPDGAAGVARVSMGGRMLAVDAAGHLYLSRNAGKSWKKIKPKWAGKAAQLAVVPVGGGAAAETVTIEPKAAGVAQVFELTTDSGAVWTSEDGKHWRARADGNR